MRFIAFTQIDQIKKAVRTVKQEEAERVVSEFYQKFRDDPTKVGPILNITDGIETWPTELAWKSMERKQRLPILSRVSYRLKQVFDAINERLVGDDRFRWKFEVKFEYLGDGKVVLYWATRKPKRTRKAKDGNREVKGAGA